VEDDERIVRFVRRGLASEGYAVDVAGSGLEAMDLVMEHPYQTVIMDVALPDLDELEVCENLRACGHPHSDVDGLEFGARQDHRLAFGGGRLHDQALCL
jgi:DNA-binding response OmpR family regulator